MDIDDVRTEMRGGFKQVDRRFKKIDQQFAKFRSETRKAFKNVDERFNGVYGEFDKLRAEMKAEGEKTRRHFDVMGEKMHESVTLVAEATAHSAVRVDDHEKRIKRLEDPR
jgi:uncharacterized coiled-coil protein SlyX